MNDASKMNRDPAALAKGRQRCWERPALEGPLVEQQARALSWEMVLCSLHHQGHWVIPGAPPPPPLPRLG